MLLPISWLKDYVDLDGITPQELETKLFSCGFEVEEANYLGKEITNCVVGVITSTKKHENADSLTICKIDCGEYGHDIQIITAAKNIFDGAHVPVALHGATLHGGINIKNGKLRGEDSFGMLCSGEELGIDDNFYPGAGVYGILILPEDTVPGTDIKEVVGLDDYVFDISVTANRPDCQSVLGMAREVAAVLKRPLKEPDYSFDASAPGDDGIKVTVKAPELCPRYIAHYVKDVKNGESPLWMRKRLSMCGINAINNIVDITNFVLLEMGQPMHAFDLSQVGGREIVVRRAESGEKITTLDEREFTLSPSNLLICDKEKPVALAGIMGGLNSEIKENTSEVLFEAAMFRKDNIRTSSRSLGQSSDSSHRFEKGVDVYTTGMAMKRALHLIDELGCGTVTATGIDADAKTEPENAEIKTTFKKINDVLGIDVPKDVSVDILKRLNFDIKCDGDSITAVAPPYRTDVEGYPDLSEEIIRMYGYDHIVPTFLKSASVTNGGLNQDQKNMNRLKQAMSDQGFYETLNYSFYSTAELDMLGLAEDAPERKAIRIKNPISENYSIMRTTLAPSILKIISSNLKKGNDDGRIYELASVFNPKQLPMTEYPDEIPTLCFGVFGDSESFLTAKGAVEAVAETFDMQFTYERAEKRYLHPGFTAKILCDGEEIGVFGKLAYDIAENFEIEKPVFVCEIDYNKLKSHFNVSKKYKPIPKFFETKRDLALITDEDAACADIESVIRSACKSVTSVKLFDVYRSDAIGSGKKSMAFNLTFTPGDDAERAFKPEEVDKFVNKILSSLKHRMNIDLR